MIELTNVTKRYGDTKAIDHLTLTFSEKKIYCLLGRNGAGKTTLMNLIAGRCTADSGRITINGRRVDSLAMPENVRYIETAQSQFNMRVIDLLRLAADINEDFDWAFAMKMVEKFDLDSRKKYKRLSLGMKTMVGTILSLSGGGEIVLLDEPVLGFDAMMRQQFYDLLQESFAAHPRIIVVSTHLIDEIAGIAEQILFIDRGRLVFQEAMTTVVDKSYQITGLTSDVEAVAKGYNVIHRETIGKFSRFYLFDQRIPPCHEIEITDVPLQALFVTMMGGEEHEER